MACLWGLVGIVKGGPTNCLLEYNEDCNEKVCVKHISDIQNARRLGDSDSSTHTVGRRRLDVHDPATSNQDGWIETHRDNVASAAPGSSASSVLSGDSLWSRSGGFRADDDGTWVDADENSKEFMHKGEGATETRRLNARSGSSGGGGSSNERRLELAEVKDSNSDSSSECSSCAASTNLRSVMAEEGSEARGWFDWWGTNPFETSNRVPFTSHHIPFWWGEFKEWEQRKKRRRRMEREREGEREGEKGVDTLDEESRTTDSSVDTKESSLGEQTSPRSDQQKKRTSEEELNPPIPRRTLTPTLEDHQPRKSSRWRYGNRNSANLSWQSYLPRVAQTLLQGRDILMEGSRGGEWADENEYYDRDFGRSSYIDRRVDERRIIDNASRIDQTRRLDSGAASIDASRSSARQEASAKAADVREARARAAEAAEDYFWEPNYEIVNGKLIDGPGPLPRPAGSPRDPVYDWSGTSWIRNVFGSTTSYAWGAPEGDACDVFNVYIISLHWSVMTITSIGYGDISPTCLEEYVTCVRGGN
jgi:hypothetical protein